MSEQTEQYDFVAIGDIVIDAFIQLNKEAADVSQDMDTGRQTLHMPFGNKLPYDEVDVINAVGNSPNAAVSAHRLGLKAALVTNLGQDRHGICTFLLSVSMDCPSTLKSLITLKRVAQSLFSNQAPSKLNLAMKPSRTCTR